MAITISTNKAQLDIALIHDFLTTSYWCSGISYEKVVKRINNSFCIGIYEGDKQVGFARIITDFESFAYLADVFIVETHRSKGLSKMLMAYIMDYPELKNLRRFMLATRDAHGLYAQFGFKPLEKVDFWLEKVNLNTYTTP